MAAALYPLQMGLRHHSEEDVTSNPNYKPMNYQPLSQSQQPPLKYMQGATPTNINAGITDFKQMGKSPLVKQEILSQSLNSPYPEEKKKSKLNIVIFFLLLTVFQ